MDLLSTAIIAALTAGAASGLTDTVKKAIIDGYEELKTLVGKKFGIGSDVADAIEKLQLKPYSPGRRQTLAEEMEAVDAPADPALLAAAQSLLALVRAVPVGQQHIQVARGVGIAQADRGSTSYTIVPDSTTGKTDE
jgi:hypothetical protein